MTINRNLRKKWQKSGLEFHSSILLVSFHVSLLSFWRMDWSSVAFPWKQLTRDVSSLILRLLGWWHCWRSFFSCIWYRLVQVMLVRVERERKRCRRMNEPWVWVWGPERPSPWGDCSCCWAADAFSCSSVIFKYSSLVYALFADGAPSAN